MLFKSRKSHCIYVNGDQMRKKAPARAKKKRKNQKFNG